jgi:hypothetical protein
MGEKGAPTGNQLMGGHLIFKEAIGKKSVAILLEERFECECE